ncbi:hypothetical protein MAR_021004 [Mya arenaria]|uniref:DDE Tnp4 domain-containing protein n=1 Tax=Mya arenaria TaxID=6604 RepID=A0ABY7E9H9_MYAAR|nr:hypothetical protein MAR_021004 [Mya arenaria]
MPCPSTQKECREVAHLSGTRRNFQHALGAIDGMHSTIKTPKNSRYYNYKGFISVVMLGLFDAYYNFPWVDIGANGSASDEQLFNSSQLKEIIDGWDINFPGPEPLTHDGKETTHFLVCEDAFALRTYNYHETKRNLSTEECILKYRHSRCMKTTASSTSSAPKAKDSARHRMDMLLSLQLNEDAFTSCPRRWQGLS